MVVVECTLGGLFIVDPDGCWVGVLARLLV